MASVTTSMTCPGYQHVHSRLQVLPGGWLGAAVAKRAIANYLNQPPGSANNLLRHDEVVKGVEWLPFEAVKGVRVAKGQGGERGDRGESGAR